MMIGTATMVLISFVMILIGVLVLWKDHQNNYNSHLPSDRSSNYSNGCQSSIVDRNDSLPCTAMIINRNTTTNVTIRHNTE
jgi:hypothetical protein